MARDYMRDQLAPMYLDDVKKILDAAVNSKNANNAGFLKQEIKKALEQIEKFYKMSEFEGLGSR